MLATALLRHQYLYRRPCGRSED